MEITTRGFLILSATFFSLSAQALHTPAGIPLGTTLKTVSPMVISGKKDVVVRGVRISNPSGACILINNGSQNILIENSEIGPCATFGVDIRGSTQVKVQNSYLHDTKNAAVLTYNVTGLHVYNNRIERYLKGVYSMSSKQTVVRHNKFLNGNPWNNRSGIFGQAVQFNTVTGAGNRINCNAIENKPGESYMYGDVINMYKSAGVSSDPIQIMSNKIKWGGITSSSSGILLGDLGSSYVYVKDNILVDPGNVGLNIVTGIGMQLINNLVYGKQQPFTWVGIHVGNMAANQGYACYGHTVSGNQVNWTNKGGGKQGYWLGNSCGTIAGWSTNNWNASIGPSIWDLGRPACNTL